MKLFFPVLLFILIISSFLYTGCSPTSSDSGVAILKGIVKDSNTQGVISGATVFLDQVNVTTTTNDAGYFAFANLSGGSYNLTVTKPGYNKFTTVVEILADDTNHWVNVPLIQKRIYSFNDIVLDIGNAGKFTYPAGSVPDISLDKDVQIRDTLVGIDNLLYLRSADMDLINPGYQTWFSNRSYLGYTQINFDTLSEYKTEDGIQRPDDRDYPNHNGLEYFIDGNNFQNQKAVWFFYLKGRQTPGSLKTFGAMYLDSAWFDAVNNIYKVRVDIKINMDGLYKFSLSSK